MRKKYFVLTISNIGMNPYTGTGTIIIGMVSEESLFQWGENKCKLAITKPLCCFEQPISDKQGKKIIDYNIAMRPLYFIPTNQEAIILEAVAVEKLGSIVEPTEENKNFELEIQETDYGDSIKIKEIFSKYLQFFLTKKELMQKQRAISAGLILPNSTIIDPNNPYKIVEK
jgi:hypothetical protein